MKKVKQILWNEIKEGSDAAIAQLKKVIESISKVEELDLKVFEENIEKSLLSLFLNLQENSRKNYQNF